ncbi:MAG: thermonuclease family protein [Bradyrhizobium sp.]|uniref:thermonuclease family protein n=1 Tax=Bradyrhizobium sp. TaxID=376 RepID=UPI003D11049B
MRRQRGGASRAPRPAFGTRDILLMVLAGLLLGLAGSRLLPGVPALPAEGEPVHYDGPPPDPYAEARRSRAILEAQDAPPARLAPVPARGGGDGADSENPSLVRVIDGDTFDYRGMRVRVADIDTPEREGRCTQETALAARATARMRALMSAGPFTLHRNPDGRDRDRYGRSLRIVTRGGRSLGDQLVAEGLARTWSGRREPWC